MGANRVEAVYRVLASPIHAAFPWPQQPEFSFTDFHQTFGVHSSRDAHDFEFNPISECIHPKSMYIPHNQALSTYGWTTATEARADNLSLNWSITTLTSTISTSHVHQTPYYSAAYLGTPAVTCLYGGTYAEFLHYNIDWQGWFDADPTMATLQPLPKFNLIANTDLSPDSNATGCQGFWGWLNRGWIIRAKLYDFDGSLLDSTEPPFSGYSAVRWQVGKNNNVRYYELKYSSVGDPILRWGTASDYSDAVEISQLKQTGSIDHREALHGGQGSQLASAGSGETAYTAVEGVYGYRFDRFEIRLIGGYLEVKIESGDTPFAWRHMLETIPTDDTDPKPIGTIHQVRVVFTDAMFASWFVNPMKFKPHAQYDSNLINIGFPPVTDAELVNYDAFFRPEPEGDYTITTSHTVEGQYVRYTLVFDNDISGIWNGADYSNLTRAIRATRIFFPEVLSNPFGVFTEIYPEEVAISQQLNLEDRSIVSDATLTFNNFGNISDSHPGGPDWPWGQWANYSGQIAITIDLMVTLYTPEGTFVESTGWVKMFTGYGNVKAPVNIVEGANSKYVMHCVDRRLSMMSPRFMLPWMDGWNEYYYAAYLANISGVKRGTVGDSDLAFIDKVPADPDLDSPGGGAYFLPLGVGGSPLMKLASGTRPWDGLGKTAKLTGFLRYFDVEGKLHYEKFVPTPGPPTAYFFAHHNFNVIPYEQYQAIFNGQIVRDMGEVRTGVWFIGIDAHGLQWAPIASKISDDGAVYDTRTSIWDQGQINCIGYENVFVDVDTQFANQEFADQAAQRAFEVFRLPGITGGISTWLHTNVFPGNWVGVIDARSGLWDPVSGSLAPMLVMGCSHRVRKGQLPTTALSLQFFPEVGSGGSAPPDVVTSNDLGDHTTSGVVGLSP